MRQIAGYGCVECALREWAGLFPGGYEEARQAIVLAMQTETTKREVARLRALLAQCEPLAHGCYKSDAPRECPGCAIKRELEGTP